MGKMSNSQKKRKKKHKSKSSKSNAKRIQTTRTTNFFASTKNIMCEMFESSREHNRSDFIVFF